MLFSQKSAQEIVDSMKKIINQELNFFSKDGLIIASTDQIRIGQVHEGAKLVIQKKENLMIEYDNQYKGARKGINIPLFINDQIVGDIGITGELEEVSKFGQIIKQMTEILIRENLATEIMFNKRNINHYIIENILHDNDYSSHSNRFKYIFDVESQKPRYTIIGTILKSNKNNINDVTNALYKEMDSLLKDNIDNIYDISGNTARILFNTDREQQALSFTEKIKNRVKENLGIDMVFGIGTLAHDVSQIKFSYENAKTALEWSLRYSKLPIEQYSGLDIGIVLSQMDMEKCQELVRKIFSQCTKDEVEEYLEILDVFSHHNGSIYKCAEEMYIHKNTFQYKLNKIKKATGYDPREMDSYFVLNLAKVLYRISQ